MFEVVVHEIAMFYPREIYSLCECCQRKQGVFEGLKAYRTADDSILMFRPEENALRMVHGAERMSMPAPDVDTFINAVKQTVLANKRWVCSLIS